jgi:hypothetical protein
MSKLVVADPIVFEPDDRARLAGWVAKTMLAWLTKERAARQEALGVNRMYSLFGRTRQPLPGMHLWIGHRLHEDGALFRAFSLDVSNLPPDLQAGARAFGAVLAIRHFVALLLHSGTADLRIDLIGNAGRR